MIRTGVSAEYVDAGISGAKDKRPEYSVSCLARRLVGRRVDGANRESPGFVVRVFYGFDFVGAELLILAAI